MFGALVEASGTKCEKLLRMIPSAYRGAREHLYPDVEEVLKERAEADPHPAFLRQGFWAKRSELVREKILLPPAGAFERSAILRARALMGASVRSDLIVRMPGLAPLSMHKLARTLHVRQPTLQPIVRNLRNFGLVKVHGVGPAACLSWIGQKAVGAEA
jgi:hypothetical protein